MCSIPTAPGEEPFDCPTALSARRSRPCIKINRPASCTAMADLPTDTDAIKREQDADDEWPPVAQRVGVRTGMLWAAQLPGPALIAMFASFTDSADICMAGRVCTSFAAIARIDEAWKGVCKTSPPTRTATILAHRSAALQKMAAQPSGLSRLQDLCGAHGLEKSDEIAQLADRIARKEASLFCSHADQRIDAIAARLGVTYGADTLHRMYIALGLHYHPKYCQSASGLLCGAPLSTRVASFLATAHGVHP